MIKKITIALSMIIAVSSLYAEPAKKDKYHMFPQAQEGFERYIIEVPKMDNDNDHKVELLIGKMMLVDCNHHSFMGKVKTVPLKGWGYKYLEISDIQNGPSTMMACSEPKTEKFISLRMTENTLRRYNSRLGTVVYVPKGYEVRYRIWSAGEKVQQAKQR